MSEQDRYFVDKDGWRFRIRTSDGECFKAAPIRWDRTSIDLGMLERDANTIETDEHGHPLPESSAEGEVEPAPVRGAYRYFKNTCNSFTYRTDGETLEFLWQEKWTKSTCLLTDLEKPEYFVSLASPAPAPDAGSPREWEALVTTSGELLDASKAHERAKLEGCKPIRVREVVATPSTVQPPPHTCDTCRHWRRDFLTKDIVTGCCVVASLFGEEDGDDRVMDDHPLITGPKFGCVHWEATDAGSVGSPRCPQCGDALEKVTQSPHGMLNSEQFDAVKAGDFLCRSCPDNGRAANKKHAYFWESELTTPPAEEETPEDDFWPCDMSMSRSQLIDRIGRMNFQLTSRKKRITSLERANQELSNRITQLERLNFEQLTALRCVWDCWTNAGSLTLATELVRALIKPLPQNPTPTPPSDAQ